jgi:hypothetical protein
MRLDAAGRAQDRETQHGAAVDPEQVREQESGSAGESWAYSTVKPRMSR